MRSESETKKQPAWTTAILRLIGGTAAWLATLALAQFGPGLLWDTELTALSWAAIALNIAAGILWIVSFAFFLRTIDELERKILLDAFTITLGAGFVGAMAYSAAGTANLVPEDFSVALFAVFLSVVYVLAFAVGKIRYR
jgi:hypothetical protein